MQHRPNLFIVGAPKCGTTALSEYLKTHPQIYVPSTKEPHFFADDFHEFRTIITEEEYLNLYENSEKEAIYYCDASVWYLYSSIALQKIREFNAQSKIIVMLRNPVQMVQSLHQQLLFTLDEDVENISDAWKLQKERETGKEIPTNNREPSFLQYAQVADYASQIEKLKELFADHQILIILFDDFIADTEKEYKKVMKFLELEPEEKKEFLLINERKKFKYRWLSKLIHHPPAIIPKVTANLKRIIGIKEFNFLLKVDRLNRKRVHKNQLKDSLLHEMKETFATGVEKLEKILGRDLSSWR